MNQTKIEKLLLLFTEHLLIALEVRLHLYILIRNGKRQIDDSGDFPQPLLKKELF